VIGRCSIGERCKIPSRHWDRSTPTSQINSAISPPSSPIKVAPVKPRACYRGAIRSAHSRVTRLFATRSLYALLWDHVTALQELAQGLIVPAPQLLG